ncbi:hypothetical protein HNV12_08655 [Methanococcoides sp. SA1]|nr:hypothetical protein [Methanococcoides sp. SA1]
MKYCYKLIITAIILSLVFFVPQAGAVSLNLELDTIEYINDLVFYSDGTYDCGNITGYLSITNPSSNHTVSDINISFSDGVTPTEKNIRELEPNSTTIISYQLPGSGAISLPSVTETTEPSTLSINEEQEIVYRVEINNPGSEEIDILSFEKSFPSQLNYTGYTTSAGSMDWVENRSVWKNFTIPPHSSESLDLIFRTTPESDIILQPSSLSFTSPAIVASRNLSLSAVTSTTFTVEKQMITEGRWKVGVIVEDASDFNYSLYRVEVYVSDMMLNETTLIKEYDLDVNLQPDDTWSDSFKYDYSGTPVFFARIYYTIPYTITGNSMPLNPAETGGFVINSVVHGEQEKKSKIDGSYTTISISPPPSPDGMDWITYEEGKVQNNDKEENYNLFYILTPILIGLILIAGIKYHIVK